jgi:delta(3,5)-delta(2,4)-dienoyl-CoA isomerase
LALTGRRFSGQEAKEFGLVSQVFGSNEELDEGVEIIAEGKLVLSFVGFSSYRYM